jgi:adenine-specific DNA-methyltransferase
MATQQEKISAIQDILNSQYSSTRWKTFLSELFTSSNFFSNPTALLGINATVASQALQIGSITIIENGITRNIAVYEVTLADNIVLERNRVGLRNLLKPHWKQQDAAFIVYHHPQDKSWRFSYVSELKTFNEAGEYVDNKTEPKRYTYVLGENESCRTAAIQFSKLQDKASNATLDDIKEAFSVEKMSKEFLTLTKITIKILYNF